MWYNDCNQSLNYNFSELLTASARLLKLFFGLCFLTYEREKRRKKSDCTRRAIDSLLIEFMN